VSRDLLFEIGVEEIPSAPLYDAMTQLKTRTTAALDGARLEYSAVHVYASPRRLAVLVSSLAEDQADLSLKVKGPAVKAAFDYEGRPTKAALGFARSRGVAVEDLVRESADGGEYVFAIVEEAGCPTAEVLPDLLAGLVADIDWGKSMRWGSGSTRFIRPVRWLTALYGSVLVPVRFAGLAAGSVSYGHRFLAGAVEVPYAGAYVETLRSALVLADAEERSETIRTGIDAAAAAEGARAVVPGKTFAEVVNLVEWPTVAIGSFDDRFLAVPREIVEEAMESHQRYFPLEAPDGSLLSRFVVVHNGAPERTDAIIAGHERVIRARLADAVFFVEEDLARPLSAFVDDLGSIVFHEKLGSLAAKVGRVERLAGALAVMAGAPQDVVAHAVRAARLAKADLVTHAVIEFTSLQGVMGYHYALASGESREVAEAVVDHYRPRFAGDVLPRSLAGKLVSTADKLDTIVGLFAIGQGPTGSADPYALRRSAIGVLAMTVDGDMPLDLDGAIAAAVEGYAEVVTDLDAAACAGMVKSFFDGRLTVMLRDRGFAHDEIEAVMAVASADPADTLHRVRALKGFRGSEAGADLSVAFRRVANLADPAAGTAPDRSLVGADEAMLIDAVEAAYGAVRTLMTESRDYEGALAALAELRAPVDSFFTNVLVMDEDPHLRVNRLALLNRLVGLFEGFADFGRLSG